MLRVNKDIRLFSILLIIYISKIIIRSDVIHILTNRSIITFSICFINISDTEWNVYNNNKFYYYYCGHVLTSHNNIILPLFSNRMIKCSLYLDTRTCLLGLHYELYPDFWNKDLLHILLHAALYEF